MYSWKTNLDVADKLLEILTSENVTEKELEKSVYEGICRTVVHKSYYACFHKVLEKNALYNQKTISGGTNAHNDAIEKIDLYDNSKTRTEKRLIINKIKQLKEYRREADYEKRSSFSIERTQSIHEIACKTYDDLNEY